MPSPKNCGPFLKLQEVGAAEFVRLVGKAGGPGPYASDMSWSPSSVQLYLGEAQRESGLHWRTAAQAEPTADAPPTASEETLRAEFEAAVQAEESSRRKVPTQDVRAVERSVKLVEDDPYSTSRITAKGKLADSAYEEDVPRTFGGGLRGGKANKPGEGGSPDDWYSYYIQATDVRETIHSVRLKCAPGKPYATLLPISDVHIGPVACAFREFSATMAWAAKHEGLYSFTIGDCLNNATLNSVEGMELGAQVLDIMPAGAVMTAAMRPIADAGRLLVLSDGNHERRWARQLGQKVSPTQFVAERLNVPYSPHSFPMIVQVGDQTYTLYIHHGTGSGQSYGHLWNTMQRFVENNRCDAALAGHRHVRGTQERSVMRATLGEDGVWYWSAEGIQMIAIGCWLRYLPGSYARDRNMPPAVLGTSLVRLYADRHLVQPLPFSIPNIHHLE